MKAGLGVLLLVCVAAGTETKQLQAYRGVTSDLQEFLRGVYMGMQSENQPDPCVTQLTDALALFDTAYTDFLGAFTGIEPTLILATIHYLSNGFNGLVAAVETCKLKVLTYNVQNIVNRVGFGKALINISVNANKVLVSPSQTYLGYIATDWSNSLYRNVGFSVGELLSIILAYEF